MTSHPADAISIWIFVSRLAQLLGTSLSVRWVWGSIPGSVKSERCRHRCDVASELCSPTLRRKDGPHQRYTATKYIFESLK